MNDASEAVIRLYLSQKDDLGFDVDDLVSALKEGYSLGETDAIEYRDALLASAVETFRGTPSESSVMSTVALHLEIESLKSTAKQLETLGSMASIVENMRPGPLGERVAEAKLKEHIEKL